MKIEFRFIDSRNVLIFDDVSVFEFNFQGDTVKLKIEAEVPITVFELSANLEGQTGLKKSTRSFFPLQQRNEKVSPLMQELDSERSSQRDQ